MQFAFAHSSMLWFLPAATLPIVFHLFFRLKKQQQPFPSLMFFKRIDPKLSAKRKIHEWLILLLRCLMIALVILALARPTTNVGSDGGVARIILIDNSASMAGLASDGTSKLILATRAAEKMLTLTHTGDSVAVQWMIPDSVSTLPQTFNAESVVVKNALRKLTPTDGTAQVVKAMRTALGILSAAKQPMRELHIITDMSKGDWGQGEMESQASELSCRVIVHRIDSKKISTGCVTVVPTQLPTLAIPAGRIVPVQVELRNYGKNNATVRLNSTDDSGKNVTRDWVVPAGESVPATLTFSFSNLGFHWAKIWLDGDAAPAANRAALGFWCVDAQKILFVGGKEHYAALPFAVSPGGNADLSGVDAVTIGLDKLVAELANRPLAIAMNWENLAQDVSADQSVQKYVRDGGILFVTPRVDSQNTTFGGQSLWLDVSLDAIKEAPQTDSVVPLQLGEKIWNGMKDADGKPKLGTLRVFRYRALKAGKDWEPLLTSSSGGILLAQRKFGKGMILASGIAFSPKWSSLPLKAGFVVMMQNFLFAGRSDQLPVEHLRAGNEVRFDMANVQANVQALSETPMQWQGLPTKFVGCPRSGVYSIQQKDHTKWVAVYSASEDMEPTFLTDKQVSSLRHLSHEVVSLNHEEDIERVDLLQRMGSSLYGWLIVAALLVALLETWISNEKIGALNRKLTDIFLKKTQSALDVKA